MTEKMKVTEKMCATEEVVDALLECMVEPLLGRSFCKSKEVPTLDQQKSMAKQIFLTKYLPTTSQNVYAWTSIYLELRMIKLGHYLDAAVELKVF
uniref:DUF7913 domain-containing protein n=1 Tax=Solanum lycopersicum TaxID=4081 RepID=A0A3Q7H574_SOLLC